MLSCTLDNYDGPDAKIYGAIIDEATGELVEQDIKNGTRISYIELGWENPTTQYMIFKSNGEYGNNLMFSADYDIFFDECNFVKPEKLSGYHLGKGETRLDFKVTPYVRFKNVNVEKQGDKVIAKFTIQATQTGNVSKIGLFGHLDKVAGNVISLDKVEKAINLPVTNETEYVLELSADKFKKGKVYNFRVGALYNAPGSKYNYSHPVELTM